MKSAKRSGAAIAPPAAEPLPGKEAAIATSVRLPKSMHDALRSIVFEERNKGNRVSIHSLMLKGLAKVIRERK